MKCIKLNSGKIERVQNERAQDLVNHGSAKFVPKKLWKKEVRDKNITITQMTLDEKEKDKSSESVKGKKRKNIKE
jgi:uncharacterized protein (UPF0261 family)